MSLGERITAQLVWWLWMPVLYGLLWLFIHGITEGTQAKQDFDQWFMANFWSTSTMFWIWLTIGTLGSLIAWVSSNDLDDSTGSGIFTGVMFLAFVGSVVGLWLTAWDIDKDYARYYNRAIVFEAPDLSAPPDSLTRLASTAKDSARSGCDQVGTADVTSCLRAGSLAKEGWQPRVASRDAAAFAIKRKSADIQKVSLSEETLVYLNATEGKRARWSGILDGSGINQAMGGVAEWDGTGEPTTCLFKNDYAIDRAFAGGRSNSLPNLLSERFPGMRFKLGDVWGYCSGQEPIVVVPMTRQIYYKSRTVDTAAGVVVVEGERGHSKLTYRTRVRAGSLPGPVYPRSLVITQRSEATWAAGRENQDRNGFGFEPVTSQAQAGNVSEYLLLNKVTGRLEWITPVRLRKSTSELIVAYEITPADAVNNGRLNVMRVSTLPPDDERRVNIDTLEARSRDYIGRQDPGFFSSGGKLREFTPVDGDTWRAYGERQGSVVYQLDISASGKIAPRLVPLKTNGEPDTGANDNKPGRGSSLRCDKELSSLTKAQLAACAKQFIDELAKRQNGAPERRP